MSKVRIIPCLDIRDGRVVKGKQFKDIVDVDSPEVLARFYSESGADELVFYDISASNEDRKNSLDFIYQVAREIDIPFCVGGGVRTLEDFAYILEKGADKVSISSGAVKNPGLLREAADKFGSQTVVLAIDAKKEGEDSWIVTRNGGREMTDLDVIEWAKKAVSLGAGEIVLNSIDEDGMKDGYDLKLLKKIKDEVDVPIIASGGAGKMEDFYDAASLAGADGLLAASVFHFGEIKIGELKEYLREKGINIKL